MLSAHLDPEELRTVVQGYQAACAAIIERYAGSIAQYLGDGLLVYFGYPAAHEDDAARAVRAGLEIVGTIHELPLPNTQLPHPLRVRIGIHTGLVVVGEMGGGAKREQLALGETPNLAARLQSLATPNTVVLSAATYRLIEGYFTCQSLGAQTLKGVPQPFEVYKVLGESGAQSRFEAAASRGLTPLIGREHEVGLLLERWERAKQAEGQVMLLSGEPGIGKSRLVQVMKEQSAEEGALRLEFRCSPYHQNSAFYPVIEHLQRVLQFGRDDTPQTKLAKLERTLAGYRFPQQDTPPLLAALLSLPHPDSYPPLNLSPQRQKQKTQEALVAWLLEETERSAVYNPWEDVHWADPSSLELLHALIDQAPTARLYILLTFRPEFTPPWGTRSHISQLTLSRLGRAQVAHMIEQVTRGKTLPGDIVQQIVAKTDGVPLFVEELTKAVLEQDVGAHSCAPLPLAIPATLHDSLMARLDRLNTAKEIAQLGATLGREFSYELIQAVSPLDAETLRKALTRLVEAELIYQRGLPPQARYVFKHALVQDAAYQSLLKSRRQQLHQQIAQVLEERFPETNETQPELLAHHYTEAGLVERAISYWQKAGEQATQRSANLEAINHLTKGLELLNTLPDTPARAHQEISLQIILGSALMASKGYAAPEVERAYTRAHELCQQVRETLQLFPVLWGLWAFYLDRAAHHTARQWGEEYLSLTQRQQNPTFLLGAHRVLGESLAWLGELDSAQAHLQQGVALANPERLQSHAFLFGQSPELDCLSRVAHVQWRRAIPTGRSRSVARCCLWPSSFPTL